jgi:transcriptional regulator with XRE-family HTH domain
MSIDAKESDPYKELAKRIRHARLELGLNQRQFAAAVGVSKSIPSQWESGAFVPRKAILERIARVVPEWHKAYFLEFERTRRRRLLVKSVPYMSSVDLDLLEKEKVVFIRKLRSQIGPWLKKYNSFHVEVNLVAGQRFVTLSFNSPSNKGVVVFLDQDLARASRTDVHASQLRSLDVDWESLLLPLGQRWSRLELQFTRTISP